VKPRALDGCCCQGAATRGLELAGFEVTGVDNVPQPHYCGERFIQADIVEYVAEHGHEYDFIHLSVPCQGYSETEQINGVGDTYPRLIAPMRYMLQGMKHPAWTIENVVGAPMHNPIELCGSMFGLGVYRHRLFESNLPITAPRHPEHIAKQTKMGRPPVEGEMIHVVGHFSGVEEARRRMGIDWMTRDGLREAIPPAYMHHVAAQVMDLMQYERAA
jgi:DNA (cytosine-5)-methyltransferase 1